MRRFFCRSFVGICLVGSLVTATGAQADYKFVSLQGPGSADTEPYGISTSGVVTGFYGDANGTYHGFSYQNGSFTNIDVPSSLNAQGTYLYAGNSLGQIAGGYVDANGIYQGTIYNGASQSWTYLSQPDPTSQLNIAGSITNSGIVFGNWSTDPTGSTGLVGYAYQNGVYTSFTAPGSNAANGGTDTFGCNNAGTLVGYYFDANGNPHGFIRTLNGTITTLDVPNELNTELYGINDSGEIVGRYRDINGIRHGFTYLNGVFTTVDFPGSANTFITGVDNNGDLVGFSFTDINNGPFNGFIAFSVPEPSSFAMVVVGAVVAAGTVRLRRRGARA